MVKHAILRFNVEKSTKKLVKIGKNAQ